MTDAQNGIGNGSGLLESAVMPQQCHEKGHVISTGEHVHGPRCPAVFWLGWQRGWQRSARSLVCTARRSLHSGCCSAPSPPDLPGRPCPRCYGGWLPLGGKKEGGNTDCSGRQAREFGWMNKTKISLPLYLLGGACTDLQRPFCSSAGWTWLAVRCLSSLHCPASLKTEDITMDKQAC